MHTPYGSLVLEEGDSLLLGTVSTERFECRIEEMRLEAGNSWATLFEILNLKSVKLQSVFGEIKHVTKNVEIEYTLH